MSKISENEYYKKGTWNTLSYPTTTKVVGFVLDKNSSIVTFGNSIFETVPQDVKIDAIANIESRITNKTVLGLTWIGVGSLPVLLGADFLVRLRLGS